MAKRNGDSQERQETQERQLKMPSYVKYVGLSDNRGITREDFAQFGIDHDSIWWHAGNRWQVPLDKISDAAYQVAIERDPELILVEEANSESDAPEEEPGVKED